MSGFLIGTTVSLRHGSRVRPGPSRTSPLRAVPTAVRASRKPGRRSRPSRATSTHVDTLTQNSSQHVPGLDLADARDGADGRTRDGKPERAAAPEPRLRA
eukprot:4373107-Prymnesium_polylepis.2